MACYTKICTRVSMPAELDRVHENPMPLEICHKLEGVGENGMRFVQLLPAEASDVATNRIEGHLCETKLIGLTEA